MQLKAHQNKGINPYPFGTVTYGRDFNFSSGYKYGFNGKEKDDEVKGNGNSQDYGMRIYDNRLGRFLSVDPLAKTYPILTPYQFATNCPISGVDMDGLEYYYTADGTLIGKIGTDNSVRVVDAEDVKKVDGSINWANKTPNPEYKAYATTGANKFSNDAGMSNDELNTRAFMATVKETENQGNAPLDYNDKHMEKGKTEKFTEKTFDEAPEDYKDHPYEGKKSSSGTAAGAYQILRPVFDLYKKKFPEDIPDFSPESQDKLVLGILAGTKSLGDLKKGDLDKVVKKLTAKPIQFTSLPGGGQSGKIVMTTVKEMFKKNVAKELQGKSNLALHKGETLDKVPKK